LYKVMKHDSVVILDNIRSVHNVGAIFRTSDAAGISKIYLTGYTPSPLDRFGRERSDLAKAALGAEKSVVWESAKTVLSVIKKLKKDGYTIIAVEQSKQSQDYKKVKAPKKVAFLMGNEVDGVSPAILKHCDIVAEIPMKGQKESLNVSVAFGIAIFRMLEV
jgi:23S rRNA (guanosine2251-2'-O)-methyltransferase